VNKGVDNGLYWGGLCDDEWWLEYLEGEFESNMTGDIEMLLKNSSGD
jgi:hypothetical protein